VQPRGWVRSVLLVLVSVAACSHAAPAPEHPCGAGWSALGGHTGGDVAALDRSAGDQEITGVRVEGVPEDLARTLASVIETRSGQTFADAPIHDDLRRLWALGVARDIRVERRGGEAAFVVVPRATVGAVVTAGDHDPLRRFALLNGAPFEPERLARVARAVEQGYVGEGRADARVRVKIAARGGTVDVCVVAKLGPKVTIASVAFPGLTGVPAKALLDLMHGGTATNHVGGVFDPDVLDADSWLLTSALMDHGFADATVKPPQVVRHGNALAVEIPIVEGAQYRLGWLDVPWTPTGAHGLRTGEVFSRKRLAEAQQRVQAEVGVYVMVMTSVDRPARIINITLKPQWRWPWDALTYWSSHSH
jgi:outer membrane protein assembly factor BamA